MRHATWMILLRCAALLALGVSAALFVDYTNAEAAFCGAGSGCDTVRRSGFGYLVVGQTGIPVPVFGIVGFCGLLTASLLPNLRWRKLATLALALAAGVGAAIFIGVQAFKIKHFCVLCMIVDTSAIVAALSAVGLVKSDPQELGRDALKTWAWGALVVIAAAAPILWARYRPMPPVPAEIRALYAKGQINVVEFADFQCPFCRMLHGQLARIVADYGKDVHFVRLNFPLKGHEHAQDAARAAVCADAQGKGDAMADALFTVPPDDLTPIGNRNTAHKLGLDVMRFEQCVMDPATDQRIERESKILRDNDLKGLPTTYVGGRRIIGAQTEDTFREAFEAAKRGDDDHGIPGPIYLVICLAAAIGVIAAGRSGAGGDRTGTGRQRSAA